MRVMMAYELFSMWQNLGKNTVHASSLCVGTVPLLSKHHTSHFHLTIDEGTGLIEVEGSFELYAAE